MSTERQQAFHSGFSAVRDPADVAAFQGVTRFFALPEYRGCLEEVSAGRFRGWLVHGSEDQPPLRLAFFDRERFLASFDVPGGFFDCPLPPPRSGDGYEVQMRVFGDPRDLFDPPVAVLAESFVVAPAAVVARPAVSPAAVELAVPVAATVSRQDAPPSVALGPELHLAGVLLGHLGEAEGDVVEGAVERLAPLRVFCRLVGLDPVEALRSGREARERLPSAEETPIADLDGVRTLADAFAGAEVGIVDLWYVSDFDLRVRLERVAGGAEDAASRTLRFYQWGTGGRGGLIAAGEATVAGSGPGFAEVALVSPYAPVLVVATDASGMFVGATLLPFPSLCRGGAHAGELSAAGLAAHQFADLKRYSDALVREFLGWPGCPSFSIGRMAVDLEGASGAERIFAPAAREFITAVLGIALGTAPGDGEAGDPVRHHLREALETNVDGRRGDASPLTLRLPPDALPTIGAMVARRLAVPARPSVGSYVLADPVTAAPRWSVTLPDLDEGILGLQPRRTGASFPVLTSRSPGDAPASASGGARVPLAIRYPVAPAAVRESVLLLPTAPDSGTPLLRRSLAEVAQPPPAVTVVVSASAPTDSLAGLLQSLAQQTVADCIDVVIAVPRRRADLPGISALLERFFPGRARCVVVDPGNRSAALNQAVRAATGSLLLVAAETALLHDRRTIETLAVMAAQDDVAVAGCVTLRERQVKNGSVVDVHAGGMFPTHLSLVSAPRLVVREVKSWAAFPSATYPVAANAFRLAMIRKSVWEGLGGIDAGRFPGAHADLDFGIRAIEAGYVNLCTSAVTATDLSRSDPDEHVDVVGVDAAAMPRWQAILARAALLRDIA